MTVLTSTRQSGGERSVSTLLFLIALQVIHLGDAGLVLLSSLGDLGTDGLGWVGFQGQEQEQDFLEDTICMQERDGVCV